MARQDRSGKRQGSFGDQLRAPWASAPERLLIRDFSAVSHLDARYRFRSIDVVFAIIRRLIGGPFCAPNGCSGRKPAAKSNDGSTINGNWERIAIGFIFRLQTEAETEASAVNTVAVPTAEQQIITTSRSPGLRRSAGDSCTCCTRARGGARQASSDAASASAICRL